MTKKHTRPKLPMLKPRVKELPQRIPMLRTRRTRTKAKPPGKR